MEGTFCNFDNGHFGFCEQCDWHDSPESCYEIEFHNPDAKEECANVCFSGGGIGGGADGPGDQFGQEGYFQYTVVAPHSECDQNAVHTLHNGDITFGGCLQLAFDAITEGWGGCNPSELMVEWGDYDRPDDPFNMGDIGKFCKCYVVHCDETNMVDNLGGHMIRFGRDDGTNPGDGGPGKILKKIVPLKM